MAAEAIGEPTNGAVRDPGFPRNLPEPGAGDESVEEGFEEIPSSKPVVGAERLRTEAPAAVMTAVPLNALRMLVAKEESLLLESPTPGFLSGITLGVRTERW